MYYIEELFCRLAYGPLRHTSLVADDHPGEIVESEQSAVTQYCNEALTRLHSRFILRENSVIVEMQEGRTNYPLLKKYAVQSYDPNEVSEPFIMDLSGEPFDEDVIKILSVWDSDGDPRPLNDKDKWWSLFTPRPTVLQNSRPRKYEALSVVYQAKHPAVDCGEGGNGVIELPDTLDAALDAYIAYKAFSTISSQEATVKAAEMLQKYEDVCNEVIEHDLVNSSRTSTGNKFNDRGFV